ncbi:MULTISPECIES: hypothetical protein [Streptomycetaceae]|uniref:Uncharacterized protein n=1 Tax=Streptantibioticus cattleyicolor (strain ATCC 35852 / DSM 46488 / JCM 4925 / NBRC 14057 / NRRL 8057) TaxID=1003195 RepID=F8JNT5_STREN|nr:MULTISPECIES: hypothetical protein [Streptomycetaceae]AEW92663.1 hypothetical protein SCATT_02920 [Streptantibioticus cattleyicolor NRRL 8057 = DSM 46488]MYS57436.1 hypothetical protein [Streptomyces sp. SID5468]CCB73020.1 conserved protein of unknown function [Streptantibioticus cattleyicolor NRRL 8057 = DSM 46488]
MTAERRTEEPGGRARAVPRDMPDQQAGPDDTTAPAAGDTADERPDETLPDTDQAGTGRRGAPHHGGGHGRQVPAEPPD